ncbi:multicopper oxidase family protein [Ramlibacter monticola]|uniref:Multicopper oxidase family protein n=1 Tax=Ramlibacter monticola TaxID=1926872 RepID=A0A936Z5G2_9BURK|nr:multicopper oxidase family protein [Ramlibacter monticola]
MSLNRRRFLQSAAAVAAVPGLPSPDALAATAPFELIAGVFKQQVRETGAASGVWGYNLQVPGPVLRFKQGEEATFLLRNRLPQATTIHWHGIRVPNEMDGVPNVTQVAIAPDTDFTYKYRLPDSGTYWYHPHQSSFEQVPRGLYGALIVEEARPVPVDREVLWVLSDFKLGPENQQVEDFGRVTDFGSGGRLGNVIAINGKAAGAQQRLELRPNERVRLRLINASSARILALDFTGHQPWVLSLDGQGVPPRPLKGQLILGGGQRTDLILDGSAGSGQFEVWDRRDKGARIATIAYAGSPVRAKVLGAPPAIPPNRLTTPNLQRASRHYLAFEGGVLGMPAIGMVDGKPQDVKSIMEQHGLSWTMNYTAQHEHALMHEPLFRFRKGEHVVIRMINRTDFEHPMHMHGHFFQVVAINNKPVKERVWRDTVVMAPRQDMDIALVADNVGEWMFHCHILDHAAGGMMGTVLVE